MASELCDWDRVYCAEKHVGGEHGICEQEPSNIVEQAIHAEGPSTSTDSRARLRDKDIAVPNDWPRAPSKATVCHDTPSTRGHSPRQHEYSPLTPRFASVASISSQQPHFMRQCGMPACCTLAGGRSPSRAVGCNSPQKRAAPEPCGPVRFLGLTWANGAL